MGNCFKFYVRQLYMYVALRKCKDDCKILKIILVPYFFHLSLKLLDFLSDFALIIIMLTRKIRVKYET